MATRKKTTVKKKVPVKKKTAVKKKTKVKKKAAAKKKVSKKKTAAKPAVADSSRENPSTQARSVEEIIQPETEALMDGISEIDLGDQLGIESIEDLKHRMQQALDQSLPIQLKADEVDQVDGAGLQLLAAFAKEAEQKSVSFEWHQPSEKLLEAIKTIGLEQMLKIDAEEVSDGEGVSWGLF